MKSVTIQIGLVAILASLAGCSADVSNGGDNPGDDGVVGAVDPGETGSVDLLADAPPTLEIAGGDSAIKASGTGCPPGSFVTQVSPDKKVFSIFFTKMVIEANPAKKFQKVFCTAGVPLRVAKGWQFAVATINTRGSAHLLKGALAQQTSKYFFPGNAPVSRLNSKIPGPFDGDYTFTDKVPFVAWSPCGGTFLFDINANLDLNTSKSVQQPDKESYVDTQVIDGAFRTELYLQFRTCH